MKTLNSSLFSGIQETLSELPTVLEELKEVLQPLYSIHSEKTRQQRDNKPKFYLHA
ncbi:hypothetical protein [Tenacibaculum sp. 1B UA]|uniref:hypothetical protein n=1 Tax=Tenacibaculum sp. 1B UA TaxID=2922252 RepID=UPI002A23C21B|nr:hypothetical protein [Tenacibaculum sp. 1B UA]